jgi:hypothetical protein
MALAFSAVLVLLLCAANIHLHGRAQVSMALLSDAAGPAFGRLTARNSGAWTFTQWAQGWRHENDLSSRPEELARMRSEWTPLNHTVWWFAPFFSGRCAGHPAAEWLGNVGMPGLEAEGRSSTLADGARTQHAQRHACGYPCLRVGIPWQRMTSFGV